MNCEVNCEVNCDVFCLLFTSQFMGIGQPTQNSWVPVAPALGFAAEAKDEGISDGAGPVYAAAMTPGDSHNPTMPKSMVQLGVCHRNGSSMAQFYGSP